MLDVTSPTRGAQLPAGAYMVEGKATSGAGIALVTVNGVPVATAANGAFQEVVNLAAGQNVVHVVATDKSGHATDASIGVLAGTFDAPGSNVKDAVAARVTNDALSKAAPAVDAILEKNLKKLTGLNVGSWSVNVLGHTVTTKVDVSHVAVGSTKVCVKADQAGLHGSLCANAVSSDLDVSVDAGKVFGIPLGFKHTLDLHFDKLSAEGLLQLTVVNGQLDVDTSGLQLSYSPTVLAQLIGQGNLNAINSLLGDVGKVIGVSLKIDEVAIVNKFLDMAWNMGLKKTADDEIAKMIVQTGTRGVPLSVGKLKATVTYAVDGFTTNATGFDILNDMGVTLSAPDVHASKGSLVKKGTAPVLAGASGVMLAVNEDAVNELLELAWRKGELDLGWSEISTGSGKLPNPFSLSFSAKDLALLVPAFNAIIPAGAGVEVEIAPKAAPVVTLAPGGKGELALTAASMKVGIVMPGGQKVTLFAVDVNATADAGFAVDPVKNTLELSIGKTSFTFDITTLVVPVGKLPIENVLDLIVPVVVQFAGQHLLGPVPLPHMNAAGLSLSVGTLTTDGAQGTFLLADITVK
jgi:hypothetical protein